MSDRLLVLLECLGCDALAAKPPQGAFGGIALHVQRLIVAILREFDGHNGRPVAEILLLRPGKAALDIPGALAPHVEDTGEEFLASVLEERRLVVVDVDIAPATALFTAENVDAELARAADSIRRDSAMLERVREAVARREFLLHGMFWTCTWLARLVCGWIENQQRQSGEPAALTAGLEDCGDFPFPLVYSCSWLGRMVEDRCSSAVSTTRDRREQEIFESASRVLVPSEALEAGLRLHYGVDPARIRLHRPPVTRPFLDTPPVPLKLEAPRIFTLVTSFSPDVPWTALLLAASLAAKKLDGPSVTLKLVGESPTWARKSPERWRVVQRIADLDQRYCSDDSGEPGHPFANVLIYYEGRVSRQGLADMFRSSHAVIVPESHHYTLAIAEALSCGARVIAPKSLTTGGDGPLSDGARLGLELVTDAHDVEMWRDCLLRPRRAADEAAVMRLRAGFCFERFCECLAGCYLDVTAGVTEGAADGRSAIGRPLRKPTQRRRERKGR